MTDCKELIGDLRLGADILSKKGALLFGGEDMIRIADAIEQLVKERDAAMSDLKELAPCDYCKWFNDNDCINIEHEKHWEWRGVQNETD